MLPPNITVVTATYNRAHLLRRLYDSLAKQSFTNFEWIVVDDGSSDDTTQILSALPSTAPFSIRLLQQENSGKHVALNKAIVAATGELTAIVDSDDQLVPMALETIWSAWARVPEYDRNDFSGVAALCADMTGRIIGTPFSADELDDYAVNQLYRQGAGDKWLVHQTRFLKRHPFPVFTGEKFLAEGAVWDILAARYKIRFINQPLQIVQYQPDGLSARSVALRASNPVGAAHYYRQLARLRISSRSARIAKVNEARFTLHARTAGKRLPFRQLFCLRRLMWSTIGLAMFARDRWQLRNRNMTSAAL
jgi:glycosyltransferase involved in cell wall biosynthesis